MATDRKRPLKPFLRIGMERAREGGELLFYVVQDGRVKIREIVAVLHRVAEERLDVLSGVAERGVVVPGVGVGARTGCVRIVCILAANHILKFLH